MFKSASSLGEINFSNIKRLEHEDENETRRVLFLQGSSY